MKIDGDIAYQRCTKFNKIHRYFDHSVVKMRRKGSHPNFTNSSKNGISSKESHNFDMNYINEVKESTLEPFNITHC